MKYYLPYDKQKEFHKNGAVARERLLMAGNQQGKTYCGSAEMAIHLSGEYPDWWEGRVWDRPIKAWVGGESSEVLRDSVQRLLVGPPEEEDEWGTGLIPQSRLINVNRRQGVANTIDTAVVAHKSGKGNSILGFKSYDQQRKKWQGASQDLVWFDEEPPMAVYMEGLTRTNATGGMVYLTFTPLLGMSEVVAMFLKGEGDYIA